MVHYRARGNSTVTEGQRHFPKLQWNGSIQEGQLCTQPGKKIVQIGTAQKGTGEKAKKTALLQYLM